MVIISFILLSADVESIWGEKKKKEMAEREKLNNIIDYTKKISELRIKSVINDSIHLI